MTEKPISGPDLSGSITLHAIRKANLFNDWMYSEFKQFLKGHVLEIGSGIGNISQYAAKDNLTLSLSDVNPDYLQRLGKDFSVFQNVKSVCELDLQHPQFTSAYAAHHQKFDSIFLLNVIEHLEQDSQAIQNCNYLLRPGGNLVVLAPAYPWLYSNLDHELGHYRRYTINSLTRLFPEEKFRILKKQYFNFSGIPGWLVFGKLFRRKWIGSEMNVFNKMVPMARIADKLIRNKSGLSALVVAQKM
jgi:SAM-dependent methyltransferase